jgi:hypothetical protein
MKTIFPTSLLILLLYSCSVFKTYEEPPVEEIKTETIAQAPDLLMIPTGQSVPVPYGMQTPLVFFDKDQVSEASHFKLESLTFSSKDSITVAENISSFMSDRKVLSDSICSVPHGVNHNMLLMGQMTPMHYGQHMPMVFMNGRKIPGDSICSVPHGGNHNMLLMGQMTPMHHGQQMPMVLMNGRKIPGDSIYPIAQGGNHDVILKSQMPPMLYGQQMPTVFLNDRKIPSDSIYSVLNKRRDVRVKAFSKPPKVEIRIYQKD